MSRADRVKSNECGRLARVLRIGSNYYNTLVRFAALDVGADGDKRTREDSAGNDPSPKRTRPGDESDDTPPSWMLDDFTESEPPPPDAEVVGLPPQSEDVDVAAVIAEASGLLARTDVPDWRLRQMLSMLSAIATDDDHDVSVREEARVLANAIVRRIAAMNDQSSSQLTQMGDSQEDVDNGDDVVMRDQTEENDNDGGAAQNYAFSPSQAADDLEDMDDDVVTAVRQPGPVTQMEREELPDDDARDRRLIELQKEVVTFLRSVPNAGPIPSTLHEHARLLRRRTEAFVRRHPIARQMSGYLSEILLRDVVDDGAGSSGQNSEQTDGSRQAAGSDAPTAPQRERIVGRAIKVMSNGTLERTYLLFEPPRSYNWLTDVGMQADPKLFPILKAYSGPAGDDPKGNGFVVDILRARGPPGRRQYRVKWTVEPQVPIKHAEEWMTRRQFVNPALVDAFEQRLRDDDDDDMQRDAEAEGMVDDEMGNGGQSALKWSTAQGKPLLSMRLAIAQNGGQFLDALWEYTVSRMFTLRCRLPPATGEPGEPTGPELAQLGKDLYEIQKKSFDAVFRRERELEERERLLSAADGDAEDEEGGEVGEDEEETALAAWRTERETELKNDALERWAAARRDNVAQLNQLQAYLDAIEALQAANAGEAPVSPEVFAGLSDTAASVVTEWTQDRNKAAATISQPRIQLPKIRDVLSQPSRSALTEGWLKLLRTIHTEASTSPQPVERLASAYGPTWPARPGPTSTPPDHVVATRALRMGAALVFEHGDPAQNPTNLVLCTLSQNSAKSDNVLGLFSAPGEVQGAAGQDIYSPAGVSEVKKAMLAKIVAMVFGLYWGVTNNKRAARIASYYEHGTGIAVYKRALDLGRLKALIRSRASDFERRNALITAAVTQWGTCNALVFNSNIFDERLERLLAVRMNGTDQMSKLVDATLQAGVAGAPR